MTGSNGLLDADPASTSFIRRRPRLTLLASLVAGLLVAQALRTGAPPGRELTLTPVVESVLTDAGAPRAGALRPDVTIVVFTDYRCPICRRTDPALHRLLAADPGVRVIFKDWPVLGEASVLSARAALAAGRQGRYLAMHRALMDMGAPADAQGLERAASRAGVDWSRLQADLEAQGPAIDDQLGRHALQAWSLGLRGTPAYMVGPYLIEGGLDDRALARAVRRARKAGPPA